MAKNTKSNSYNLEQISRFNNTYDSEKNEFDPFANRKLQRPTNDTETLIHLLKSALGSGILSMSFAFKCSGVLTGVFLMTIVAVICTHCAYILVKCAHELYRRTIKSQMTYAEVTYVAFSNGPKNLKKYANAGRYIVLVCIFIAYFGTCSVYSALIAQNIKQVVEQTIEINLNIRYYIAALMIPAILLCWIPDLKSLAIVSLLSNVLMAVSLTIIAYYIYSDFDDLSDVNLITNKITEWPSFITITVFAMSAIGVIMPLENNMQTPQNFIGATGVLNKSMFVVSILYTAMGIFGYMTYGSDTNPNITYGMPKNLLGNSCRVMISTAVLLTFALQFFVCLEIVWNAIKDKFPKNQILYNYITRTILVILAVSVAIAVPNIEPLISLLSALCFSILGIFMPALIETMVFWDNNFGLFDWKTYKNIIITIFSLICLIFGSQTALNGIYREYFPHSFNDNNSTLNVI